jgi:hypothetical protein
MTSFYCFVTKPAIYRLGIISLAHVQVHVTDFSVVNVHVDKLSSARIWQHKLCATLSANVDINYRLPIKVYYRICTLRHIRIKIIYGSQYNSRSVKRTIVVFKQLHLIYKIYDIYYYFVHWIFKYVYNINYIYLYNTRYTRQCCKFIISRLTVCRCQGIK